MSKARVAAAYRSAPPDVVRHPTSPTHGRRTHAAEFSALILCLLWAGWGHAQGELLQNPEFAADLVSWSLEPGATFDGTSGFPGPGALRISNQSRYPNFSSRVHQCIPLDDLEATRVVFSAATSGLTPGGGVALEITFYSGPDCSSGVVGGANTSAQGSEAWQGLVVATVPPATTQSANYSLGVFKGPAGGGVEALFDHAHAGATTRGDLNADGNADVVFQSPASPESPLALWFMTGPALAVGGSLAPLRSVVGTSDFNSDGVTDVAYQQAGDLRVCLRKPLQHECSADAPVEARPGWQVVATADFNQDGKADILWRNTTTQALDVRLLQGLTPIGSLTPEPDHAVDANWNVAAATDFNADHNADLLWYNATSGKIVFWFMDAAVQRLTGQFANPASAGNNNWKVVGAADYGPLDGPRVLGSFLSPDSETPPTAWTVVAPR